ncbi:MAG: hypothetical protein IPN69_08170 [Acidobacteria bacterium]|nr:hypothetical protein [Acidobacteriota bacterium]
MRPKIARQDVERILAKRGVQDPVALVGIRGYYLDSKGKPGTNDRGIYDDAIILITPKICITFLANTDPSIFRPGIATMRPGVHRYYKGKHKQRYWALRLVGETVPVTRDGQTGTKTGIALNIHKGCFRTTGSEGCQTIHPQYWDEFIELVYDAMDDYGQTTVPYCLVEEVERRRDTPIASAAEPREPQKPAELPAAVTSVAAAPVSETPYVSAPELVQPTPAGTITATLEETDWSGKLGGYAQQFDQVDQVVSRVSGSSWLITGVTKLTGVALLIWSLIKENWIESIIAGCLIVAAIWYLTRSKDRGFQKEKLRFSKGL